MTSAPSVSAEQLRASVERTLEGFLAEQTRVMAGISPDLAPFTDALAQLLAGGKRLRPAFCVWAYVGAGGRELDAALRAAASLELLQACALVHDDIMDDSDTRRGGPSAHRRFATMHREADWLGDRKRFGEGSAILLGDLCLSWSDQMLHSSGFGPEALGRAQVVYDVMRTELMSGQYLDLLEQARGGGSVQRALLVVRYKSAKYTIERPLHLGAALAGAAAAYVHTMSAYGLPLGEAFQLRDDVLGVFGDTGTTGKPAGDDLREGKRTLLVAAALQRATPQQAQRLRSGLGDASLSATSIEELREIIATTGALDEVESLIAQRTDEAVSALDDADLEQPVVTALTDLAAAATVRSL